MFVKASGDGCGHESNDPPPKTGGRESGAWSRAEGQAGPSPWEAEGGGLGTLCAVPCLSGAQPKAPDSLSTEPFGGTLV